MNWQHGDYSLSDDQLDLDASVALIQSTWWAGTRPRAVIEHSLKHSLNFALFHRGQQVGIARVVTDRATVGYLCDVIIAEAHRGQGTGQWLLQTLLDHPDLRACRIDLFTRDAEEFYRPFGFGPHKYTNLVRIGVGISGAKERHRGA